MDNSMVFLFVPLAMGVLGLIVASIIDRLGGSGALPHGPGRAAQA